MPHMIVTVKKLNRRSSPINNVGDKSNIIDTVNKGFSFDSITETSNAAGTWYSDDQQQFYWAGGLLVDVATNTIAQPATEPAVLNRSAILLKPPASVPVDLPLTHDSCKKCTTWMKTNFEDKAIKATENTPFDTELLYAIACQETAQRWSLWIKNFDTKTIIERCVFDASGDVPGTLRSAFPKNKAAMLAKYGNKLTQTLIDEANKMRALPQPGAPGGFHPSNILYKGYGIFQYDLQHIETDKTFFEDNLWYSIDECLNRLIKELNIKWKQHNNDMLSTVRSYNGSGKRAEQYAQNVSQFYTWIKAL